MLAGEPRTGHHIWKDGVLVPAGMLMETSGSENLDTRSNNWTLGIISTNGGAIATNAALSPKGDMTAATITASGSPGSGVQAGIDVGGPDGRKFTGGASLRAGTVSEVKITLMASGGGLGFTSKVVSLTSEWQELSHLIDLSSVTGGDYLRIRFTSDQEGTFEIYERLIQEGAVSRSHVPTDGSAVDVASESLQIDPVVLSAAFGGAMPDEVTFLMKGMMSRAKDPVSYANAIPFGWQVDGGNYLDMIVSTANTHTGRPYFRNRVASTPQQVVVGPEDALDLGIEVPFSLGLVVGATELEGFLDGVSLGTVTHGGLANLLSVPLKLFPVGSATLEEFCIWAEALPSAAMIEATS
ncbi:hypothetical protein [Pseudophaeobacter sp.]|uniref:phage head spike fiber domain-containing protein n=1 Tax=Pseudophaeobacter sp. TaxID=1971739 RepID=UPI003297FAD0